MLSKCNRINFTNFLFSNKRFSVVQPNRKCSPFFLWHFYASEFSLSIIFLFFLFFVKTFLFYLAVDNLYVSLLTLHYKRIMYCNVLSVCFYLNLFRSLHISCCASVLFFTLFALYPVSKHFYWYFLVPFHVFLFFVLFFFFFATRCKI